MAYKKPFVKRSRQFEVHDGEHYIEVEMCEENNMEIYGVGDDDASLEFDTIEMAERYTRLLNEAIEEAKRVRDGK